MRNIATASRFCIALLFCACVHANPNLPNVVHGQVSFSNPDPHTLNIQNTPGAIINWQSFGIAANEITQFIQQSANSAVLNRVVGTDPSALLGTLSSNGQVYLINPNGIVIGQNALIDTAGFVASTLDMTDDDFKRGELNFQDGGGAGNIINKGFIKVGNGGNILLVAPSITNEGSISTEGGSLTLAAGHSVTITSLDDPALQFEIQAPENTVINLGEMVVGQGAAAIFAGTIRHEGMISANSLAVDAQGRVQLIASHDISVSESATVDASGEVGGAVRIESLTSDSVVKGKVLAVGEQLGGKIKILGERVGVFNEAVVDASGKLGGGEVLVGGDFQGANQNIRNATQTIVGDKATIKANATESGDGGKIITWADGYTSFAGRAEAVGGTTVGDGGFVEISGKQTLAFSGEVDASAANGKAGDVLFDPKNIDINDAGGAAVNSNDEFSESPAASVQIDPSDIVGILSGGTNVTLQANNDITVTSNITGDTVGADDFLLTLQAGRTVDIDANISLGFADLSVIANDASAIALNRDAGVGSILVRQDRSLDSGPGFGTISLLVSTGGTVGNISLAEGAVVSPFEAAATFEVAAGGSIILAPAGGSAAARIATAGGDITLTADTIDLQGSGTQLDAASGVGFVGTVTLRPSSAQDIEIVSATLGTPGVLELEAGDLQNIDLDGASDGVLVIGTGNTVDITVVDAFTPAGGGNTKDRVEFVGSGDFTINGALDGTGLTGVDSGHSLEANIGGDINFNAAVNTGAANGLFQFGQDGSGGTVSLNDVAITSPALTLAGGAGVDALVGSATLADIYTINGANQGTFDNANTSLLLFTDIENLNAGGGDDQFVIQPGGSLGGFIDGGAGTDTLDFSAIATVVNATIVGVGGTDGVDVNEATITSGITNINQLISGSATTDTLTGANAVSNWLITPGTTVASYQTGLSILPIDGFESLIGGTGADTFAIGGADAALLQNLDGGAGSDALQFGGDTVSVAQALLNMESMLIASGNVAVNTALSLETLTMLAGTLDGTAGGDINISSAFNITAFGQPAVISTTRTIQLLGGSTSNFLVDITGSIDFNGSGSLINNGTINLNIGVGDGTATFANTYGFSNLGSVTVTDGALAFGGAFANAGSVVLNQASANLNVGGVLTNNASGTISGLGTVTATGGFVNNGTIDPGIAAIGQLNVVGDVTFNSGSSLDVEITSGLSSDVLNVTGNVALNTGATLNVTAVSGYTGGGGGDNFTGVIAASGTLAGTSGQFDSVSQPLGFSVTDAYTPGPAGDLTLTSSAIAFNQWIGGAAGDWDIAANWSLGLPGAAADVLIDTIGAVVTHDSGTDTINTLSMIAGVSLDITGGILTISSASTIDGNTNLSGGTLNYNATTVHNGSFNWSGGSLTAPNTVSLVGVTTISGATLTLSNSVVEHSNASGASTLTVNQLNLDASTFRNTGSLDVDTSGGNVLIDQDFIAAGTFENQGTLTKLGAGRLDFFNGATLTFNNSGALDIQAGDIFLQNTTSIIGGTLSGAGRLIWDRGNGSINLIVNSPSTFEISSGTHALSANSSISGTGNFEWLSGTISSSSLDLTVNSPFSTSTSGLTLSSTDLIHTNASGSSIFSSSQINLDNSEFTNAAGAILEISTPLVTDTVLIDQDFVAAGTFTNDGTLIKTGAGRLDFFNGATLTFTSNDTLDIQAGDVFLRNTNTVLGGNISGAGTLIWDSGSLGGSINLAAPTTFEISGGSHTLTTNTTINGPGQFNWLAGTVSSSNLDLTVNAPMVTSTAPLTLSSTDLIHTNSSGSSVFSASQIDLDNSEFSNAAGAILEVSTPLLTDTTIIDQDFVAAGAFRNFGTLNKTGLGRLDFFNGATLTFENTGTLNIQNGDVFLRNTASILNGNLAGGGKLIWDSGTVQASLNIAAPSSLEISGGPHTLGAASTLSGLGNVIWLSGTIQSNDLTVNTPLFITGASAKRYSSGTFIHSNSGGTSLFDSTGTLDLDAAEFRNTGVLNIDSSAGTVFIDQDFVAAGLFNNQGTLQKTGAGQFNVFSSATLTFQNSGVLDIQAGEIFIDNTSILNGSLTGAGKIVWNSGSSSGNLTIAAPSLLEISGGTHSFSAASNYSGAGIVRWSGGTISGSDLTIDSIFEVTGASAKRQSGMTITHTNTGGASLLDSTGTWDLDGATFNNSGVLNIDSTAGTVFLDQDLIAGSFFNNQGTINKTGTGRLEVFSGATIIFDNDGTLNIVNGEVAVNQPFTNDGLIDIASGTILSGGNATFVNGASGTIQGVGTIVTPAAGLNNSGMISPGNGTIGTLNVTGNLIFNSGGTYDVQLAPGFVSDQIVVTGNTTLNAGSVLDVTTTGGYAGNLADNFAGAISTTGSLNGAFATINQPGFTVNPNYTIGPAGDMTLVVGGVFNNWTGAVNNDWNTPGNWTLGIVPDGSHDVRINTVGQTITVGGAGTNIVNTLGVVAGSAVQFTASNLQLNANSTVNGDLSIGTTLTGGGDITSNGIFELTGGALNGLGDIFINNLFNINNTGGNAAIGRTVHINSGGSGVWQAAAQDLINSGAGNIQVHSGGSFDAQANATSALDMTVDAGGVLQRSAGGGTATISGNVINNGTVSAQSGILSVAGAFTDNGMIDVGSGATFSVPAGFTQNGGTTNLAAGGTLDVGVNAITVLAAGLLTGNGTVNGDVNNTGGTVSAGASPGTLLINGNYTQGAGGTLLVEVQNPGTTQGVDYDHITITGTANLDGILQVALLGGFVPTQGQTFDILNYGSALGNFASIPDVNLSPGTQAFGGSAQGVFFQLTAGEPIVPVPVIVEPPPSFVDPSIPSTEELTEADLSEVIALEENNSLLDFDLEEEESEDDKKYKICSG